MADVEAGARSYGVAIELVRRAQLAADVRERLTAIEQRAAALRYSARTALEDAAELRAVVSQVQRQFETRKLDVRLRREDVAEAEALLALLAVEVTRATGTAEAAQQRAADAGRVAENVKAHLGLVGGGLVIDRTRGSEAAA